MKHSHLITFFAALVSTPFWAPLDGEWKPQADPITAGMNPPSNSEVYMQEHELIIPSLYADWFQHIHRACTPITCSSSGKRRFPTVLAIGDVDGVDDGEKHIVLSSEGEAVLAARLNVDLQTQTTTLEPIFFWLSPHARAVWPSTPDASHPSGFQAVYPPATHGDAIVEDDDYVLPENILIWDFDGDGKNEVAVITTHADNSRGLYLLQHDGSQAPIDGYAHPDAVVLDSTTPGLPKTHISERLGICRVSSDSGPPRDIIMHEHSGLNVSIWNYQFDAGTQSTELELQYRAGVTGNPTQTTDATPNVGAHEISWADVTGDGRDEVFHDGAIRFVNDDGTRTNNEFGKKLWSTGNSQSNNSHMDQMFVADWDPTHPGLELMAMTENAFTPPGGTSIEPASVLYDPLTGDILSQNDNAPTKDLQTVLGGHFAEDVCGLQAIFSPKDFNNTIGPPGSPDSYASLATDAWHNTMAVDGVAFGPVGNTPTDPFGEQIVTGPTQPGIRQQMWQIDWDGDYTTDEIAAQCWEVAYVFRMGSKDELAQYDMTNWPTWLPKESDLVTGSGPGTPIPFRTVSGTDYYIHYYQGTGPFNLHPEWAWNPGPDGLASGPGAYTHFYQKLGEVYGARLRFQLPYDVVGDHREELIVMNTAGLYLYLNPDPLTAPARISPHCFEEYRLQRMNPHALPFAFRDLSHDVTLEIRPVDPNLPSRVAGIRQRYGSIQLQALLHYPDGSTQDVTSSVDWIQDPDTAAQFDWTVPGRVRAIDIEASACVRARYTSSCMQLDSNPFYVMATAKEEPVVLMAGFDSSFLNDGATGRPLKIRAYVAQKNNVTPVVAVVNPDNSYWYVNGVKTYLVDDGTSGDEIAGDGIYSINISPPPQDLAGIVIGENLKLVEAAVFGPNVTWSSNLTFNAGPDFYLSEPWPYTTKGTYAPPVSCNGIPGPFSCTWPAMPGPIDPNLAVDGPRILHAGARGMTGSNQLFLEAVVAPHCGENVTVSALLPGNTTPTPLVPRGDGRYTLKVPYPGTSGSHIIPIQATADVSADLSDYWPMLYLHDL